MVREGEMKNFNGRWLAGVYNRNMKKENTKLTWSKKNLTIQQPTN